MPRRTISQSVGSQGYRFVQYLIESNGDWIVRGQEEDFGIDLEVELAEGDVKGQILKLQIKSSAHIQPVDNLITFKIATSFLRYVSTWRIPVLLIVVSIQTQTAWYLWLQKWIDELHQSGGTIEEFGASVTIKIPSYQNLADGLKDDLKNIARWTTKTQLTLSLADALRTATAVRSKEVMAVLSQLLESIDSAYRDYPIEIIIDEVLNLGQRIWATTEGNEVSQMLFRLCKEHGDRFNAKQILRLVIRGDSVSRTGINAVGILYDHFPKHTASLNLPEAFSKHEDPRALYYCKLREVYLGNKLHEIVCSGKDLAIDKFTLDIDDRFLDKWANRGDSIVLDYFHIEKDK